MARPTLKCVASLIEKVNNTIARRRLLAKGGCVAVAVSGGLDSVCLLEILVQLAGRHSIKLSVLHYNHQLRGRASDADERFVRALAKKHHLPISAGSGDVRKHAAEQGASIEMAAREMRHKFFARAAKDTGARVVALAHHANDQAELFLLRLLRGAGYEGLGGMTYQAPSPVNKGLKLIRPLLDASRAEIEVFAAEFKIRHREDSSNRDDTILRNRVRHKLLPLVAAEFQPAILPIVGRAMEVLRDGGDFLAHLAREWRRGRDPVFSQLHPALQREVIRMELIELGIEPGFELIERLREAPLTPVETPRSRIIRLESDGRIFLYSEPDLAFKPEEITVRLSRKGTIQLKGLDIIYQTRRRIGRGVPKVSGGEVFDADKVGQTVVIRHWRAGDLFQPIGMSKPVKLKKLFNSAGIAPEARRALWLAESRENGIFWVRGLRISECCKVTPLTRKLIIWRPRAV